MNVMLTGAGGMLARAVRGEADARGHELAAFERVELDVTDARAVERAVDDIGPDVVIQCAAYTRVDDAEDDREAALLVNATATAHVARACRGIGARLVYPSTDYVFDGRATRPYPPDAEPSPVNAYGWSKLAGERAARQAGDFLIVRTSWLYGAGGRNFVAAMLERARAGEPLRVVDDQRGSPTWTRSLARVMLGLIERGAESGTYHAANRGDTTWHGLAVAAIEAAGLYVEVEPVGSGAFPRPAPRPGYSVLDCSATEAVVGPIPEWRDALRDAVAEGV